MMRPSTAAFLLASLAFAALAGCASHPSAKPDGVIVVRSPDDYSYLNQTDPWSRPHVHDYWGGNRQLTEMDADVPVYSTVVVPLPGQRFGLGDFRMGDGEVIPQGAGNVTLTITHAPQPGDAYADVQVQVRTADGEGYTEGLPVTDQPIHLQLKPADADLPHQSLSAWRFRVSMGPPPYGPVRMSGTLHIKVVAERGLPIPLFEGHPDQWNGSSQIRLFEGSRSLYDSAPDMPGQGPTCTVVIPLGNCYFMHLPEDGVVVPFNAAVVEVRLTVDRAVPPGLALYYHGADTWSFAKAVPVQESGGERLYQIPVSGNGDGPYSQRSLWEFMVVGEDRRVEYGSYSIAADVLRQAPLMPASAGGSDAAAPGPSAPAAFTAERDLTVVPGQSYRFTLQGDGQPVRIRIHMASGLSRDGVLVGPGACATTMGTSAIVGVSTGGNVVLDAKCGVLDAGEYALRFDSGESAFRGTLSVDGARVD